VGKNNLVSTTELIYKMKGFEYCIQLYRHHRQWPYMILMSRCNRIVKYVILNNNRNSYFSIFIDDHIWSDVNFQIDRVLSSNEFDFLTCCFLAFFVTKSSSISWAGHFFSAASSITMEMVMTMAAHCWWQRGSQMWVMSSQNSEE